MPTDPPNPEGRPPRPTTAKSAEAGNGLLGVSSGSTKPIEREEHDAATARDIYHLPTGSVVIRYSNPSDPEPFYLQRVTNERQEHGYWAVHMINGQRAATLAEAEWRASEVADGDPWVIDEVAWAHREAS